MGRPTDQPNPTAPVLGVRGLCVERPPGFALRLDAFRLDAGGCAVLLGPSGAGKSTLLAGAFDHVRIGDTLRATGEVSLFGAPRPRAHSAQWRAAMSGPVTFVPQDARAALDPVQRIGVQLAALTGAAEASVLEALATLGVDAPAALAERYPHQVSGGEGQRVLLAIALLRAARLCVLDEPSTGLDEPRVADLVRALRRLRDGPHRTALWIATHDRRLVTALDGVAMHVENGRVMPGAPHLAPWPAPAAPSGPRVLVAALAGAGARAGRAWLCEHVDLAIHRHENVALVGPSGAGKTSAGRLLAGSLAPARGRVQRPAGRCAVQMVFQDAGGSLTPGRTLRWLCRDALRAARRRDVDVMAEAAALGLEPALLDRTGAELSGGEQRRAALLRALLAEPLLLVLDEPTADLDRRTALRVVERLLALQEQRGFAILWITHDDSLATAVAQRIVHISKGRTCT